MSVNGITTSTQNYETKSTTKTKANQNQKSDNISQNNDSTVAVYEKSSETCDNKQIYKADNATVEKLKADAERRSESLRSLVEKMLLKQGQTLLDSTDIYTLLREGKLQVDPEVSAQAKKDIAEDGYWGVEQTSERLLSFAKALSGGDPSKADELIDAVKKGFSQATKAWGDELPDICQKTLDASIKKLEAWRDGIEDSDDNESMSNNAKEVFNGQAGTDAIAK